MKRIFLSLLFISTPFTTHSEGKIEKLGMHVAEWCISLGFIYLGSKIIKKDLIESLVISGDIISKRIMHSLEPEPAPEEVPQFKLMQETFNSVIIGEEILEEVKQVVDFLHNPEKFEAVGAKMPHGILLSSDPGNGKTLLARAIAGEAGVPFIHVSGSEFIEMYVGVGAARIRSLFKTARECAPCIIFIDEIDAVGAMRSTSNDGRGLEHSQTLNQLLTEMDGFASKDDQIVVLAATNRANCLDNALTRPGRFDRKIEIPYPDLVQRTKIIKLHSSKVPLDSSVNIHKIACGTTGFSGADLANLVNEAALITSASEQKVVTNDAFEEARDKILLGKESRTISLTDHDKEITAFHEAGHAIIRLLLPEVSDPLHKVTIVPRGSALGVNHSLPDREKYSTTKEEMIATINICLGGRAAEELIFNEIATGASNDFQKATAIAHAMVCQYGMSEELGPIIYSHAYKEFDYSPETATKIDEAVKKIITNCYEQTKKMLTENRYLLDILALELLKKETLYSHEIYELLKIKPRKDHRFINS
jgi:cell division protease FtsH